MAHELTETDGLVLAGAGAWHGLGTIVRDAPTPMEALDLAKLNWLVKQDPLLRQRTGGVCKKVVENYRSDNGHALGVVGSGFKPVQNIELAEFATELAQEGDVTRIETAGSIKGGRRVWFCIRAASFAPTPKDKMATFLMIANGHDGSLAASFYRTSIRVVCSNTLKMSLGNAEGTMVRFRHEGDIQKKLEIARKSLAIYDKSVNLYAKQVQALSDAKMSKDEVLRWVAEALTITEGELVSKDQATNKRAIAKRDRQVEAIQDIWAGLNREAQQLDVGFSPWLAFNAVTRWQQHLRKVRGKDEAAKIENRRYTDLFGPINKAKGKTWDAALALVPALA